MANPLEFLFSIFLVGHPPFVARLTAEKVKLSDRIEVTRFRRRNGKIVKYQLSLLGIHRPKIYHNALLRDILFHFPDQDFVSFLLTDDVTNLPFVGWPQQKDSGPFMRFGAYDWVWRKNGKDLVATDEGGTFTFSNEEARCLGDILAADRQQQQISPPTFTS